MFKTIYSKYLVSFALLLGFGFFTIALIISYVFTNYSLNSKADIMNKSAKVIYSTIIKDMGESKESFSNTVKENKNDYHSLFGSLTDYSNSSIVLIDNEGNVVFKNGENNLIKNTKISEEDLNKIWNSQNGAKLSDLNGLFHTERFNYVYPIEETVDGEKSLAGIILLSCSDSGMQNVFDRIIKVIIFLSLFVFLAAIVLVYFISKKITAPIKQISKAVDSYTKGNFDVRIPVKEKDNDEITTLAVAFNNMAKELEKLEKNKNTFISSISHDLKTPMTSIQGFIEGMIDGTIPAERQGYYLNVVLKEVKRLSRLVNSLLDVSRMESGGLKLNPTYFDVCEMARLILISFEEKIEKSKINIEFEADDDPSRVFADRDAIYQVIYNIVGNALKFTYENGILRIEIRKIESENKYSISIYNTGIGIKKEELEHIFDRFYKAASSSGLDKTGTGLGLYIAKTKIQAHGEKITVDSEYEKYCRFTFTLSIDERKQ
ncbi:MAG: HAMP domain-containing histidine kinase [Clostridia bacterium]|nr:HAMP domain-containing histidine kinase [Clostridia bacterium]